VSIPYGLSGTALSPPGSAGGIADPLSYRFRRAGLPFFPAFVNRIGSASKSFNEKITV